MTRFTKISVLLTSLVALGAAAPAASAANDVDKKKFFAASAALQPNPRVSSLDPERRHFRSIDPNRRHFRSLST